MATLLGLGTKHTAQTKLNVAPPPRSRYFLFTFRKMKVWYHVLWNELLQTVTFNRKNWVDNILWHISLLLPSRCPVSQSYGTTDHCGSGSVSHPSLHIWHLASISFWTLYQLSWLDIICPHKESHSWNAYSLLPLLFLFLTSSL